MCFSPQASFAASAILMTTGVATLRQMSSKNQVWLASIPLLFGIQQFSEGLNWLYLNEQIASQTLFTISQHLFLFFAILMWPTWIPFSFLIIEKVDWRRKLLWINFGIGLAFSVFYIFYGKHESVSIVNHSLQYKGQVPFQFYLGILYPIIVLLPIFLSSLKNAWIFGILIAMAYLIADYFYAATFVSVWCFFASFVSLSIYKIIKDNKSIRIHSI
jgi:hypothetical protein